MVGWRAGLTGFTIGALALVCASTATAADPPELALWLQRRAEIARALVEPIALCVARKDTSHPSFHGCVDWHSAVHGTWALLVYRRLSGDSAHDRLIAATLDASKIAAERRDLAAAADFEMPYGRAWFLALAIEAHRQFGRADMLDFGRDLAQSLVVRYRRAPPSPFAQAYDSANWALINLHRFGHYARDQALIDFVRDMVEKEYLPIAPHCEEAREQRPRPQFMAVCSAAAWLVAQVVPGPAGLDWARRFLGDADGWRPVEKALNAHHYGLNFSRAWGMWGMYRATGEARYARAFVRHFEANFSRADWWKGDYMANAHWVAQFGMMALMLSYEDRP